MLSYPFTFPKIGGRLVRRLNRFVIEAEIDGQLEKAYLANPGRLWELLLPGTGLLLSPALSRGKLPYTVLACEKEGRHVLLHTHMTNRVVRALIDERRLPPYKNYRVIRAEPAFGRHRFDLLLQHRENGRHCYLEIKSVTLFESLTAAFPDAVTRRGAEHLYLLKELTSRGVETSCLFVIMNPGIKYFIPAHHVDFNFARALLDVRGSVELNALALGFDDSFTGVTSVRAASIPYAFIEEELHDRGVYLLLLLMDQRKVINLQNLGNVEFKQGYYVYIGPASDNLGQEAARHKQKRKKRKLPIDDLTAVAGMITPIPIITGENLVSELAAELETIAGPPVKGFASPDSDGTGSLFYFAANPLYNRHFIDLILRHRLIRMEQKLLARGDPF